MSIDDVKKCGLQAEENDRQVTPLIIEVDSRNLRIFQLLFDEEQEAILSLDSCQVFDGHGRRDDISFAIKKRPSPKFGEVFPASGVVGTPGILIGLGEMGKKLVERYQEAGSLFDSKNSLGKQKPILVIVGDLACSEIRQKADALFGTARHIQ